jgi:excisionase family DNA binding protein
MDTLYTINETFKLLKISRAKLYQLIEKGDLKPIKLGGRTLFTESELTRFIESLKRGAAESQGDRGE